MTEWRAVTLGEVMALDVDTVAVNPNDVYPIVGVLNRGRGLLVREAISGRETAYKTLNRIRPGQVVYSRLKAFEGAITVVPDHADEAFASQEFPTFTCEALISPDFFRLATTTPSMWVRLKALSTGMGGRRERVKPSAFLTIPLALPPMPMQERIVEVIGAVDDQIYALDAEATARASARTGVIDALIANHGGDESATLGSLGTFERGRRFTKKDYVESGLPCIHYGQIYTEYGAVATKSVTFLPESFRASMRLARRGDLVIAGTGENTEDIGKAVAWLGDEDVAVHDDAYIYRHTLDPAFASALFATTTLRSQRTPSDSKVARLSARDLGAISVPLVDHAAQVQIGEAMRALDGGIEASRAEAERLRAVRASLLSALLNREIEIDVAEEAVA